MYVGCCQGVMYVECSSSQYDICKIITTFVFCVVSQDAVCYICALASDYGCGDNFEY